MQQLPCKLFQSCLPGPPWYESSAQETPLHVRFSLDLIICFNMNNKDYLTQNLVIIWNLTSHLGDCQFWMSLHFLWLISNKVQTLLVIVRTILVLYCLYNVLWCSRTGPHQPNQEFWFVCLRFGPFRSFWSK